jgi:hypothetical protein
MRIGSILYKMVGKVDFSPQRRKGRKEEQKLGRRFHESRQVSKNLTGLQNA